MSAAFRLPDDLMERLVKLARERGSDAETYLTEMVRRLVDFHSKPDPTAEELSRAQAEMFRELGRDERWDGAPQ